MILLALEGGNEKICIHCFMTEKKRPQRPSCGVFFVIFFNEAKNIRWKDFVMMNISCKFEDSTYNTLASRGLTGKSAHTVAAY